MTPTRYQRRLYSLLTVVLVSPLFYWFPTTTAWADSTFTGCGGEIVAAQNTAFEERVVELVNERRAEAGLPPMKSAPVLTDAARYHAADMVADDYFAHESQDRVNGALTKVCSWADRVRQYYSDSWSLAENIAWGYGSPESVMEGWMDSTGHRRNILGDYAEIGVGYVDRRWVQDFGTRRQAAALVINGEARQTDSPAITLYIHGDGNQLRLRNDEQPWGEWQTFQNELSWTLLNIAGERRVHVEVQQGNATVHSSDTIVLTGNAAPTATPRPPATPNPNLDETIYLPMITR